MDTVNVIPVAAINFYPDGPKKTAESLKDKICIWNTSSNHGLWISVLALNLPFECKFL